MSLLGGALLAAAFSVAAPAAAQFLLTEDLERAAFAAADSNGDGAIDEAELAADAIAAFMALDANGDTVVGRSEVVGVSDEAFARVDADGDGAIDLDELRLSKLAAFNSADRLQTGRVTLAEVLARRERPLVVTE